MRRITHNDETVEGLQPPQRSAKRTRLTVYVFKDKTSCSVLLVEGKTQEWNGTNRVPIDTWRMRGVGTEVYVPILPDRPEDTKDPEVES